MPSTGVPGSARAMSSAGRLKSPPRRKPRKRGGQTLPDVQESIRDLESELPPVDDATQQAIAGFDGKLPAEATGLILGGVYQPCAVPVYNWHDHGLEFEAGDGARRRHPKKTDLDLFVLHWTGGEAPPPRMYKVLDRRELGIEFAIGATGDVWQFCDPLKVDTFDAGPYNRRSIGVEIVNYGFGAGRNRANRTHYNCVLNGHKRNFAHFFPAQLKAAVALVDAVIESGKTKIARKVPRTPDGSFISRKMAKSELAQFDGVCGHFHISMKKSDPGLDIFREFIKCGF